MVKQLSTEEKEQELSDSFIFAESEKNSTLAAGGCGVCQRKGLPIFLVRKAVIKKGYKNISWSDDVRSLGNREPSIPLETHEYVYRTLRQGYIYILAKNASGSFDPIGYEVTPSGVFRHKSIHDMKERNIKEIPQSCTTDAHHIPGLFINIDTSLYKDEAYIAYTRRALSPQAIKRYCDMAQNDANNTALKRFSKIKLDLATNGFSEPTKLSPEKRSFAFNDFFNKTKLLELELKAEDVYCPNNKLDPNDADSMLEAQARAVGRFFSVHPFNSLNYSYHGKTSMVNNIDILRHHVAQLEHKKAVGPDLSISALIVEDTFGVAEELSYQRQLKIEPITQMIAKTEEIYTKKVDEYYRKIVTSPSDIRVFLNEAIGDFTASHPEDAQYMYGNNAGKVYHQGEVEYLGQKHTYRVQVAKDKLLDKEYLVTYQNLSSTGIEYDYFNEKSMHVRKHKSYIDAYYLALEERYAETGDKVVYDYAYTVNNMYCNFIMSDSYIKRGYIEQPLSQAEKDELLAGDSLWSPITYIDVRKFVIPNSARGEGQKKLKEEWKKYHSLLNKTREKIFLEQEKEMYNALTASIHLHSKDYFYYMTWLLGSKSCEASDYLPKDLKSYNEVEFWKIECDTNCSNNHIGYLSDFIKIIDYSCLGNIQLDYQYGLWEILLRDETTLYYHLIKGEKTQQQNSFWQLLLETRYAIDYSLIGPHQEELSTPIDIEAKTKQALEQLLAEHGNALDERFFVEKGAHILNLYQLLIIRMSAAVSQKQLEKRSLVDSELLQTHLLHAAMVIAGTTGALFKISVPKAQAKQLLRNLSLSATVFTINSEPLLNEPFMLSEAEDNSGEQGELIISMYDIAVDSKALYDKLSSVVAIDKEAFKANIANLKNQGQFNGVLQLKQDWLNNKNGLAASGSIVQLKSESLPLLLNGISAYCLYCKNQQLIQQLENDMSLGQTLRDNLQRELLKGSAQFMVKSVAVIDSVLKAINRSLPNSLRAVIQTSSTLSRLSNNILKSFHSAAVALSIVASAISLLDAFGNLQKGLRLMNQNALATRNVYFVAGALQMVSALSSLVYGMGLFLGALGPIGVICLLASIFCGILASVVLLIWEDDSDKWSAMQTWFNRSLLGLWEHQDKGKPYPVSFSGMAYSMKDYFIARCNLGCNISTYRESYLTEKIFPNESYEDLQVRKSISKGLYLYLRFPGYNDEISDFEGVVRINHKGRNQVVTLNIERGDDYPIVTVKQTENSFFTPRDQKYLEPVRLEKELALKKVGREEFYDFEKHPITKQPTQTYLVFYKLGEYVGLDSVEIDCRINYWQAGKTITNNQATATTLPLVVDYAYNMAKE